MIIVVAQQFRGMHGIFRGNNRRPYIPLGERVYGRAGLNRRLAARGGWGNNTSQRISPARTEPTFEETS
jgi:hypothetical protein